MNNHAILAIDIGATKITTIIAQNDLNYRINILGVGNVKSAGVNKGSIVDIDLASNAIDEAISMARSSCNAIIDKTFIAISGTHAKALRSSGAVNIQSGQITHNEINQVLQMALYNAKIIPDYDVIHVLPLYFKIDDSNEIKNPLNMHGSRLEVYVNIVTAKKTALVNIQNALKKSNLDTTSFVLNGYASSIAVLEDDQKKLGSVVLDLGGSISEMTIFKGQTIVYNDVVPIGSENITNDLSIILHTPYNAANMIKNQYGSLLPANSNHNLDDMQTISKVKIPILGNESQSKEIPLTHIQPIIQARVEELLVLLKEKIISSGMDEQIDGGIVITGGMGKIKGLQELASKVFDNVSVKVSSPLNIQNGYIDFSNYALSTIAGLLKYALDKNPFFELDSNKELRNKLEDKNIGANVSDVVDDDNALHSIKLEKNKTKNSFFDKLGKWL
jgi:cell division protein FtsA